MSHYLCSAKNVFIVVFGVNVQDQEVQHHHLEASELVLFLESGEKPLNR